MKVRDCLKGLVGLSLNDCTCFEDGRPDDYNASEFDLYLDDPLWSVPIKWSKEVAADCGNGSVWDLLERARDLGIRYFIKDLSGGARTKYTTASPFNDWIGKDAHNKVYSNHKQHVGLSIDPIYWSGTKALIDEIDWFGTDGTYTLEIIKNETDIVHTAAITPSANVARYRPETPIELEFNDEHGRKNSYEIIIDTQNAGHPRNNQLVCCGGTIKGSDYVKVRGITFDSSRDGTLYTVPFGFRVHMRLTCGNGWLCRTWDEANDWDGVAADMIKLYGIREFLSMILNDPQPYANLSPEIIMAKINSVNEEIKKDMPWVSANIPFDAGSCWSCKPLSRKSEILI